MGSPRVGSIPASARLVCFLGFLGFPCFRGGVGGGGLGYGLLSRWGHPAWVRFPLLAILSCALAVLTFRATRAVVGCYIWSRPFGNAHAGSRTRVTSMGGLYDTATLHAPWHAVWIGWSGGCLVGGLVGWLVLVAWSVGWGWLLGFSVEMRMGQQPSSEPTIQAPNNQPTNT